MKPSGWPTVVPRIVTSDVRGVAEFMRAVFDAQEDVVDRGPATLHIDDSMILVGDGGGVRDAFPAFLYVYVSDADVVYGRAVAAGAETLEPPLDTPYGQRRATVRDRWGNIWQIATLKTPD